jgi:hypothetical protein
MAEDSGDDEHEQNDDPVHRVLNEIGIDDTHGLTVPLVVFTDDPRLRDCFHLRARPIKKNPTAAMRMTVIQLVTFQVRITSLSIWTPQQNCEIGYTKIIRESRAKCNSYLLNST